MKNLFYFPAIILFIACNTWQSDESSSSDDDSSTIVRGRDTVYLVRNTHITPANSYNDLFLDSAAVEQFIQQKSISGEDAKKMRSFYNYRNGQFAWFNTSGFSEQARGFWNLKDAFKSSTEDTILQKRMDTLLNTDTLNVSRFDTSIASTELALTHAFLQFHNTNRDKIQFANLSAEKLIPVKKENALVFADTLMQRHADSSTGRSGNSQYYLLKQKLELYTSLARQGGWQALNVGRKQLQKSTSSPDIVLLKKRLQQTGDYSGTDTSKIFNDSLEIAIKNYQLRNGMDTTGKINDTLIRSLNVPVEQRIRQLVINLSRAQWMLAEDASDYIRVNIPDFMLSVYENGTKVFDMPVVVGKEGTNTMMFSGKLNQIVFSPYWNIPASIVQKDILPAMETDPDYLKKNRMEITSRNDSLPVIRQLPGEHNGLGKVKFLFPNRYDIYFHDTKSKEIFDSTKRALSHGCIRLADAEKMSNYLLRNTSGWTPEKVHTAMNSGKEQYVKISKPVPVSITYLTAWVDEKGQLHFRDDIYGHDRRVAPMMFDIQSATTVGNSIDSSSADATKEG
jgi:murein L,D-transpeptidase YcbB/YkuD